ncbi:PEGA domain-containing protein [Patescibacteria group bacterium]
MTFKRVVIFFSVLILLPITTYFAIRFVRGERIDFKTKSFTPTGLLVANSFPEGASVFIDSKLKTATDDTLNLVPGEYKVGIKKDGFHPWEKSLKIEKELVTRVEAHLFSSFPSLNSLTYTGAQNPVLSPNGQKIIFSVASDSATASKRGLWVLDLGSRPFGLNREPRQIIASTESKDFSTTTYQWSPDSKQVLITFPTPTLKSRLPHQHYLLESDFLSDPETLIDVSPSLEAILEQWQEEITLRHQAQLSKLPTRLLEVLSANTGQITFSPNEKRLLYTATASATIPDKISSPLPASSSQPETREIKPDGIYVYDLLEDKNFVLPLESLNQKTNQVKGATTQVNLTPGIALENSAYLTWFPTSAHLFIASENKVSLVEYDNTNWTDIYTGPFDNGFAFPFPSGDKVLILASLGENQPANLYAVGLR